MVADCEEGETIVEKKTNDCLLDKSQKGECPRL